MHTSWSKEQTHFSNAYFIHISILFFCVDTNNCCKWLLSRTAAIVSVSSWHLVSCLSISETQPSIPIIVNTQTKWLPRKYTWPLGGYSRLYKSPKYIFSKSSTARAGACARASASEAPSSSSAWYATSSRASNLVKIATTGTAKDKNFRYQSLCNRMK